jgi:hypothetical protein
MGRRGLYPAIAGAVTAAAFALAAGAAPSRHFAGQSLSAREWQADCLADEILEIARDSSRDYVKKVGVDGKVTWVVDLEHIARCGLRISVLKWTAARMTPRKYGNPQC